jgi:hypothetical protein
MHPTMVVVSQLYQQSTTGIANVTTTSATLQQRRWMGASNYHNKPLKIDRSALNPCEQKRKQPRFTDHMKAELEAIEQRFKLLDLERYGRHRGIECARRILLDEKIEKRASTATGNIYLNNWIYRRYSLKLGYDKVTDVPGDVLANTLIRDGTTIRFFKYKNAKTILLELYRYPERPTSMQKRYLLKDHRAEMTEEEADGMLNFDTEFLTPEEEEAEKRMWDRTMFAPKLFGYKARREADKRKRSGPY